VKLPAHKARLPGNEISFLLVPLDPAYKAGLAGHLPVTGYVVDITFVSVGFSSAMLVSYSREI
jgi:hypothetical protein